MGKIEIEQVAQTETVDSPTQLEQTEVHHQQAISELEQRLVREAVNAIKQTKEALTAIEKDDRDAAIEAIERAVGELDVILARDRDLALLPTDYATAIIDLAPKDDKTIREIRHEIKSAINFGYFDVARRLLNSLKSEIRVIITNLPLASYPDALKLAVTLIDENKNKEAIKTLETTLSTLAVEEEYLPIPLLKAHKLIEDAAVEGDKEEAMQLLASAHAQLKLSQHLGYAEADVKYDELKTELENLEKQLKADEHSQHAFRELKTKVAGFFQRISKAKKH